MSTAGSAWLRRLALAATLAAGFAAGPAAAAPFAVEIGGVRMVLDAPAGFSDTTFTGSPRLEELAQSMTSASNRILLFALTDGDMRAFSVGDAPELRRSLLVVTPRHLEREWISAAQFASYVGESIAADAAQTPASGYQKLLDEQPFGQPVTLARLFRERDAVAVLQGTRLPSRDRAAETQTYALSSTVILWLRGKLLSVSLITRYESPADADWIVAMTRRWADVLRRLNAR